MDASSGTAHESHLGTYTRVIITLSALTAAEFGLAWAIHGAAAALFVLGVLGLLALAAWKAVLVARVFMHLKYDPRILSLLALVPLVLATPLVLFGIWDGASGPSFGG